MENPITEPPALPAGTDSKQEVVASTESEVSEVTIAANNVANDVQPQTTSSNQISLFPMKCCLLGRI